MPINQVNIPTAKTLDGLRGNVEHEVNLTIQQINADRNRFTHKIDAQGNTVTNLPWPSQGGDAVPLKYLESVLPVIKKRRAAAVTIGQKNFHLVFKAAIAQNGTPLLGMSFPGASPVSGAVIAGANVLQAVELIPAGTYVQDHFPLPDDWASAIDCAVYWLSTGGAVSPTWSIAVAGAGDTDTPDPAYNTPTTAADSVAAAGTLAITQLTGLDVTGVSPGDMLYFKVGRSDANGGNAGLLELRFAILRNL